MAKHLTNIKHCRRIHNQ